MRTTLVIMLLLSWLLETRGQACTDTMYRHGFYSQDSIYAINHIPLSDGGSLVIGETRHYPDRKGLVLRLTNAGNIAWSKQIGADGYPDLNRALQLSDGSFIIAGSVLDPSLYTSHGLFVKLDDQGNLIWQKIYRLNGGNLNPIYIHHISEGINKDILVSWERGAVNQAANDDQSSSVLIRLNQDGELVWNRYLAASQYTGLSGISLVNGKIVVCGHVFDDASLCFDLGLAGGLVMMELDYATGNTLKQKHFCFQGFGTGMFGSGLGPQFLDMIKMDNGNLAVFGMLFQSTATAYCYKIYFDQDLNPYYSKLYGTPYPWDYHLTWIRVLSSSEMVIVNINPVTQKRTYSFLDGNDHVTGSKATDLLVDMIPISYPYNFTVHAPDHSLQNKSSNRISIVNNHTISGRQYIEFTSVHKSGNSLPCFVESSLSVTSAPFNLSLSPWSWPFLASNRIVSASGNITISDYATQKQELCSVINTCSEINIHGRDTVCSNNPVEFIAQKGNCHKEVAWDYDPVWISSSSQLNDSVISIQFNQPGSPSIVKLYASLPGCDVKDSIEITLIPSRASLPADTVICGAVNLRLNAGPWFKNYLWQDGSADSVFVANDKGIYWVKAEDYCGNVFTDSIKILEPFVDLGKDTIICKGDQLIVTATPGFSNYDWQPTDVIPVSDHSVSVSPVTPTDYIISALSIGGCTASDTIHIDLYSDIPDFMIADTSVCSFDILTLKPSASFASYLWNNGSTSPSITIDQPGTYWLQVTDQNSCRKKEKVIVSFKDCPVYVYIPTAFTPNNDSRNDLFKPAISGRLVLYRFEIYNRWGQVVFFTTDPHKGWDGAINGQLQDTGAFVWTCQYQLDGQNREQRSGTVMLIR